MLNSSSSDLEIDSRAILSLIFWFEDDVSFRFFLLLDLDPVLVHHVLLQDHEPKTSRVVWICFNEDPWLAPLAGQLRLKNRVKDNGLVNIDKMAFFLDVLSRTSFMSCVHELYIIGPLATKLRPPHVHPFLHQFFFPLPLLLVLFRVPLDFHAVMYSILMTSHVLHVGEPLSAEITWKVPDAQMDGYSVSVEIKLSLKPFSAVGTRPLRQLSVHHADMQV